MSELFNQQQSDHDKQVGMAFAEYSNREALELGRIAAVSMAVAGDGRCDADRVGRYLKRVYQIDTLGPSAGSLFKCKDWEWTGHFRKSARVSNHSRLLRIWRYVGDEVAT